MAKSKGISKSAFIKHIATNAGLTPQQVKEVFGHTAALATKEAKNSVSIPGLGKLRLHDRKARIGRNPATGAKIKIPAKQVMKFHLEKSLKNPKLHKQHVQRYHPVRRLKQG